MRVKSFLLFLVCVNVYASDEVHLSDFASRILEKSEHYQAQLQSGAQAYNEAQKQLFNIQESQAKLFVMISFSMPEKLILDYFEQANTMDAWLVIQGFEDNKMEKMLSTLARWDDKVDISRLLIDPNLFEQYQVNSVPSIILTKDNYPCDTAICKAMDFDKITGSIRLDYALDVMERQGDLKEVAKQWGQHE